MEVVHQKMNFCLCIAVSKCDGRDELRAVNNMEHIQNATGKNSINAGNLC